MLLHLDTHHIQAQRFSAQVAASEPLKTMWQQTIKAKIRNQARFWNLLVKIPCPLQPGE